MASAAVTDGELRAFEEFAKKAARFRLPRRGRIPLDRFRTFATRGLEIVAAPTRKSRQDLAAAIRTLGHWYTQQDLLTATGYKFQEDHLTRLVAWLLKPDLHPPSSRARQFRWLDRLGVEIHDRRVVEPQLHVTTEDGIPDLVLDYPRDLIVLEAKLDSREHPAPSGRPQTRAYVRSAKRKFDPAGAKRCRIVYLTKDRARASNGRAITTTFGEFALVQAEILLRRRVDDDLNAAVRMVITYMLKTATPKEASMQGVLEKQELWRDIVKDDLAFADHRDEIDSLLRTLGLGTKK